jgi:hypothetical protein
MLADLEGVLSNTANLPLGVMFAAVAVVSLRTKVFPTWLGWLAVLAALAMFTLTFTVVAASGPLAPQGWATYVLLLPPTLWFVPAPIIMHRRAGAAGAAASNDPSAPARTRTGAHTSRSRGRRADNPSKGERAWSGNECWPSPAWALHRLSPSTC